MLNETCKFMCLLIFGFPPTLQIVLWFRPARLCLLVADSLVDVCLFSSRELLLV